MNLAARLCAHAADGQTLVDSATADAAGGPVGLTPLGSQALKGFAEPVPIFLHRGPPGGSDRAEPTPSDRRAAGGRSRG